MSEMDAGRTSVGIEGLDEVLQGGLPAGRAYLIAGDPGAGKTTLAMQFLLEGRRRGERCLYVTLSESEEELNQIAASHGFDLEGIEILDLMAESAPLSQDANYTILHPSEVELGETTRVIKERFEAVHPARVCFDSLSELRLLARDSLRFRREVLGIKATLSSRGCTTLFLDRRTTKLEFQLASLVHGVIELAQESVEFGTDRRYLIVRKVRGSTFSGGQHDYVIRRGGLVVFPRLTAAESRVGYVPQPYPTGIARLDMLLGGGVGTGTSTILLGPSGVGKSTLAAAWALAAARRGDRALVYLFDESPATWVCRLTGLGYAPGEYIQQGSISLEEVDPAEMSPTQFGNLVVDQVTKTGASVVVIDTINGYLNAMPAARYLGLHLHELLQMLRHLEVVSILVMTQHGILGMDVRSPIDLSYLADGVILLRYFEAAGEVRKAVSVLKKRHGDHERTIRELTFSSSAGIAVGERLEDIQGVLSGNLVYTGRHDRLGVSARPKDDA